MKVHEIMTAHARSVSLENTLVEAAGLMRELDVGALPVVDGEALKGIVTDRDLVVRGLADGRDPNATQVGEVMTAGVFSVPADASVEDAVRLMEQKQIRRLPVLGRDQRVVGIVSLGDVAMSSNPAFGGIALRDVSQPSRPNARQRSRGRESAGYDLRGMSDGMRPTRSRSRAGRSKKPGPQKRGATRGVAAKRKPERKLEGAQRRKSAAGKRK